MELSVRRIAEPANRIYLTFDDGPDRVGTEKILNVLREKKAPATFFIIAEKLRSAPELVERIGREGHAFGNHSLDHRYGVFFRGTSALREWVERSEAIFRDEAIKTVGFRPPAGVVNPPLRKALGQLGMPLILWDQRFYDTVVPWSARRALPSVRRLRSGSIVLLHDRQRENRIEGFCETLGRWIDAVRARGFEFAPLSRELCRAQIRR